MANIYKRTGANRRKSGKNWVARIRRSDRRAITRSFREYNEAKRWAQITEGELSLGVAEQPAQDRADGESRTVYDALELYRETAPKRLKPTTWEACERPIVDYWQSHEFADRLIGTLFDDEIQQWIAESLTDGRPSSTVRKRLDILRRALKAGLIRWRLNLRNPAAGHRIKRDAKRRRRPTPAEKTALYNEALVSRGDMIYWAMRWAEECGMRRTEIAALQASHIDFSTTPPVLTIPLTKTNPRAYYMWVQLIDLYREIQQVFGPGQYLFGGVRPDSITQSFERVRQRANVSNAVTFHSFRYEANSWMVEAGVDRKLRKIIIGHVSDEMSDHYTHFSEVAGEIMTAASSTATRQKAPKPSAVKRGKYPPRNCGDAVQKRQ